MQTQPDLSTQESPSAATPPGESRQPKRLVDRLREASRARRLGRRTQAAYLRWIRRFIVFHGKRHPERMGQEEVARFLAVVATEAGASASTHNQAFTALQFLYQGMLGRELPALGTLAHPSARQSPTVGAGRSEVRARLANLRCRTAPAPSAPPGG
jgi:hypothetical protein